MKTAPEPLGSGAVLQASRREAEPRRQLLRRHTQEQQSARGGQKGQGGGAGREGEHQLLLLHHRPAQGDQLPLDGQAQPVPLQAGKGEGIPGGGAVAHGLAGVEGPGQRPRRAGQQHRPAGDGPRAGPAPCRR